MVLLLAIPFQCLDAARLRRNIWILWPCTALYLAVLCFIVAYEILALTFANKPIVISLITVTVLEAMMLGVLSAIFTWESFILAAAMLLMILLLLVNYARTATTDLRGWGLSAVGMLGLICSSGMAYLIVAFVELGQTTPLLLWDMLGVLCFVCYIVWKTHVIMNGYGSRKYFFSVDDHFIAALSLHTDIVSGFVHTILSCGT